jgi:uncharacterized membrane protein
MADPSKPLTDTQVEQILGNLLRVGVIASALLVVAGGAIYLVRHGTEAAEHRVFHGEPVQLTKPAGIVEAALALRGRGIIQLGLLVLIATPVARVVFSVFAFARERDYTYVLMTLVVLALLLYSLFFAKAG